MEMMECGEKAISFQLTANSFFMQLNVSRKGLIVCIAQMGGIMEKVKAESLCATGVSKQWPSWTPRSHQHSAHSLQPVAAVRFPRLRSFYQNRNAE